MSNSATLIQYVDAVRNQDTNQSRQSLGFLHSNNGEYRWYCWWLKSRTTWDVWNPINNGINYLSTGAGFQPSRVSWILEVISTKFVLQSSKDSWMVTIFCDSDMYNSSNYHFIWSYSPCGHFLPTGINNLNNPVEKKLLRTQISRYDADGTCNALLSGKSLKTLKYFLVGGFNPSENYARQIGLFPPTSFHSLIDPPYIYIYMGPNHDLWWPPVRYQPTILQLHRFFWPAHLSTNHSLCSQKCFTLHIAGTADTRHLGTKSRKSCGKKMPNQKKQVSLF